METKQIKKCLSDFNIMKATEARKQYSAILKNYRKKLLTELLEKDSSDDRFKKDVIRFITFAIEKPEELEAELELQLKLIQQQEKEYDL